MFYTEPNTLKEFFILLEIKKCVDHYFLGCLYNPEEFILDDPEFFFKHLRYQKDAREIAVALSLN